MKQVPNIFTLLNLFFGCIAIVFALQTTAIEIYQDENLATSFNLPEKLVYASICIGIAAIIDFLDGFVARILNATSEMGKQLDSLCDVVSFGVAPSVLLYQLLRISFMKESNGFDKSLFWLAPAFLVAMAGAYRLARFNTDNTQAFGFKGVPIPAAGLVVASLPLIIFYNYFNGSINALLLNKWVLYAFIVLLSLLMISCLPMLALKFKNFNPSQNMPIIILAVIAIVAAIVLKWLAVPVVFIAYVVVSLLFKNKTT
jgi:CDP-diacylglycerol--serine O-phosphatidyltransferase